MLGTLEQTQNPIMLGEAERPSTRQHLQKERVVVDVSHVFEAARWLAVHQHNSGVDFLGMYVSNEVQLVVLAATRE